MDKTEIYTPACLIADYRFVEFLGEGTSGRTYLAERRADRMRTAVKVLKINGAFKDIELFEREAKTLSQIDVEGVPKFIGYVKSADILDEAYLIQEYVPYPSLQSCLDAGDVFSEDEVLSIVQNVANILRRLQQDYTPPIIHRDIKPSNIMYDRESGRCWLIDFGAVANPQRKSAGSTVAGTMGFMAPEQLMGECTIQSDYYALGATALNLLTGVPPVDMHYDETDPFKLDFDAYLPSKTSNRMRSLLRLLLASKSGDRPKNIAVLLNELDQVKVNWSKNAVYSPGCYLFCKKIFLNIALILIMLLIGFPAWFYLYSMGSEYTCYPNDLMHIIRVLFILTSAAILMAESGIFLSFNNPFSRWVYRKSYVCETSSRQTNVYDLILREVVTLALCTGIYANTIFSFEYSGFAEAEFLFVFIGTGFFWLILMMNIRTSREFFWKAAGIEFIASMLLYGLFYPVSGYIIGLPENVYEYIYYVLLLWAALRIISWIVNALQQKFIGKRIFYKISDWNACIENKYRAYVLCYSSIHGGKRCGLFCIRRDAFDKRKYISDGITVAFDVKEADDIVIEGMPDSLRTRTFGMGGTNQAEMPVDISGREAAGEDSIFEDEVKKEKKDGTDSVIEEAGARHADAPSKCSSETERKLRDSVPSEELSGTCGAGGSIKGAEKSPSAGTERNFAGFDMPLYDLTVPECSGYHIEIQRDSDDNSSDSDEKRNAAIQGGDYAASFYDVIS